jgi:hypothetical protein
MAESMIERIARQICISAQIDPNKYISETETDLQLGRHSAWKAFRNEARAILAAMREPTAAMAQAAPNGASGWPAMIDAALAEG